MRSNQGRASEPRGFVSRRKGGIVAEGDKHGAETS